MSSLDYLKKYTTVVADTGNFEGKYDFVVMETCLPLYLVSMSKFIYVIMNLKKKKKKYEQDLG